MSVGFYVRGSWRALRATAMNMFRPVVTEGIRAHETRADRYRASFALVHDEHGDEACIGCKMCERICPSTVITVIPAGKRESPNTGKKRAFCEDFTLDLQACIFCELCVQVCPTDAIIMMRVQEQPGYVREDLVLTMDKLYANENGKPHSWHDGTKLFAMQDPKKTGSSELVDAVIEAREAAVSGDEAAATAAAERAKQLAKDGGAT
jgi:NADH-quinone oxidoreductase subunit I